MFSPPKAVLSGGFPPGGVGFEGSSKASKSGPSADEDFGICGLGGLGVGAAVAGAG